MRKRSVILEESTDKVADRAKQMADESMKKIKAKGKDISEKVKNAGKHMKQGAVK